MYILLNTQATCSFALYTGSHELNGRYFADYTFQSAWYYFKKKDQIHNEVAMVQLGTESLCLFVQLSPTCQCKWKFGRASGKQAWASGILYRLYKKLSSLGECQNFLASQPVVSPGPNELSHWLNRMWGHLLNIQWLVGYFMASYTYLCT